MSNMQTYTREQVLDELRRLVAKSNQILVAAELGMSAAGLSLVLSRQRGLSADLALRLGFVRVPTPELYMRKPTVKGKSK